MGVSVASALAIARKAAKEYRAAVRRRAMKRWLRARGIAYPKSAWYSEVALRKLVCGELQPSGADSQGGEVE